MANDGHFWVNADINGQQVRFLIDSGASITTVSRTTADQAGLETGMRVEHVETANGTVLMRKSRAERLIVGPIERQDIGVNVNESDATNVLGMNFLSSLTRWSVEGRSLVMVS
jgi:aspartyl protease family protein